MGYHTNPWMVDENKDILTAILSGISNDQPTELSVAKCLNISTEQYRLRRILAATDYHPEACGGVFAGLGQRCTIRVDMSKHQLVVVPKTTPRGVGTMKLGLTEVIPNEIDMITKVKSPDHTENITILSFEPSPAYDVTEFGQALGDAGWTIHLSTLIISDARITVAVERITTDEPSGFDILNRK